MDFLGGILTTYYESSRVYFTINDKLYIFCLIKFINIAIFLLCEKNITSMLAVYVSLFGNALTNSANFIFFSDYQFIYPDHGIAHMHEQSCALK